MSSSVRTNPVLIAVCSGFIVGCSSGTGGSDVGEASDSAPTARAQVLNGAGANEFREGAEVFLTGKASEDVGGPIIDWRWRQTSGPSVRLLEVNAAGVSFTAPAVRESTALEFELAVEDSGGNVGTTNTRVTIVPGPDTDKFLSLDIRSGAAFDHFMAVAALREGAETGATPVPFRLSARAYIAYPPRSSPDSDCSLAARDFADGPPAVTSTGCRVEMLEDLTPAPLPDGGTGIAGAWPAGVTVPEEQPHETLSRAWNPRFALRIPHVDVREFSQRFIDAGRRHDLLDAFSADRLRLIVDVRLSANENQSDATLMIASLDDNLVRVIDPLSAGVPERLRVENSGTGLPTIAIVPQENLLASIEGRESALTSEVYYRTVDPGGTRTTLNDWLAQAGFTSDFSGTLLPEAVAGTGEFAHAVYLNNFDLGFGREMYARTDQYGNVFSFVNNYVSLENAIRRVDAFVTVVTEFSPLSDHADPSEKFVKFFTYIDDGSGDMRRVGSFDFDGRGQRWTPGNCTVCHLGVKPPGVSELVFDSACAERTDPACYAWPAENRDGEAIANGDLQSVFLPWDIDSLLFADTDPAILEAPVRFGGLTLSDELARLYGDYGRSSQEAQLKRLNQSAYRTIAGRPRFAPMQRLIEHWYGGVDVDGRLIGSYDDSVPVAGWRSGELVPDPENPGELLENPPAAERIYHAVFARHCRACHIALIHDTLRFDDYQKLIARRPFRGLYRTATMPGSRLTMDRFWVPQHGGQPPGEILAEHVAEVSGEPVQPAPGAAHAIFEGFDPPPRRGETLFLDAWASQFADRYLWDVSVPSGSKSALTGDETAHPMLVPDVPGRYVVGLTVNPGSENEDRTEAAIVVANKPPLATDLLFDMNVAASVTLHGSLVSGIVSDLDADELDFALSGPSPGSGNVAVDENGDFTYSFTGSAATAPIFDRFDYELRDPYGGTARASATILLVGATSGARPGAPILLAAEDSSVIAADDSDFSVTLRIVAADDDVGVVAYDVYRDGAILDSFDAAEPPGTEFTYRDSTAMPGRQHVYRLAARDSEGSGPLSDPISVRVIASLRSNILSGWGPAGGSVWRFSGCLDCHGAGGASPILSGSATAVYAALLSDRNAPSRRVIDDTMPWKSTLLCKALVTADPYGCRHFADDVFVRSDPRYRVIADWISAGAPDN